MRASGFHDFAMPISQHTHPNAASRLAPASDTPVVEARFPLPCLERLRRALDAALDRPPHARGAGLRDALRDFADPAELAPLIAGCGPACSSGYRREILLADPKGRYCAVALIWGPAQFSPIHGHHTWCAYRVLSGALHESRFEWQEAGQHAQWRTDEARLPGAVSYTDAGFEGIHRLGNPHPTTAVSLHVYGVDAPDVATRVNRLVDAVGRPRA